MTRIAPTTSNERTASSTRLSLSSRGASRIAPRPIGALTKKTHSQPTYSVRHRRTGRRRRRRRPRRRPRRERLVALRALGERRREDRERRRCDQRAAEALDRARRDQQVVGVREAAGERGDHEQRQPEHEQPAAPEQVGHAAAEQEEPAERQGVRTGDPLQVRIVKSSSRWIVGSATLTIETSMMSMNWVAQSRMSAIQRRGRVRPTT